MQVNLDAIGLRYGQRRVLEGLNGILEAGKVHAVAGPSGSGKSSLLALIGGHRRPTEGRIWLSVGGNSFSPSPHFTTWVPQGSNALGHRTAIENVMLGALATGASYGEAEAVSLQALGRVGLADQAEQFVRQMSGGETQRVGFARALVSGADLILADEPSSALDEANTINLAELLKELRASKTIIVATHDPILLAAAEDVLHIRSHDAAR